MSADLKWTGLSFKGSNGSVYFGWYYQDNEMQWRKIGVWSLKDRGWSKSSTWKYINGKREVNLDRSRRLKEHQIIPIRNFIEAYEAINS